MVLDRLRREGEPDFRHVEVLTPLQVSRDEYRRDPVSCEHVFSSPSCSDWRCRYGNRVEMSISISWGGAANPPSIPACMRGMRMPSRNCSQLCFDSCTATMVQPSGDAPAA